MLLVLKCFFLAGVLMPHAKCATMKKRVSGRRGAFVVHSASITVMPTLVEDICSRK